MREYLKLGIIAFLFILVNTVNSRVVAHGDIFAALSVGVMVSVLWFNGVQSVIKNRNRVALLCWTLGAMGGQLFGILVVKKVLGF
jgi:hypothetical protein